MLRTSIVLSHDFALNRHRSPSFGSHSTDSASYPFPINQERVWLRPPLPPERGVEQVHQSHLDYAIRQTPVSITRLLADTEDSLIRVSRQVKEGPLEPRPRVEAPQGSASTPSSERAPGRGPSCARRLSHRHAGFVLDNTRTSAHKCRGGQTTAHGGAPRGTATLNCSFNTQQHLRP